MMALSIYIIPLDKEIRHLKRDSHLRGNCLFSLLAHGQSGYTPQRLPVLQEVAGLEPNDNDAPSLPNFDEKVDIFLRTCSLPQDGQTTPSVFIPKISSSKISSQSLQTNSKIGIFCSLTNRFQSFDAGAAKKLHY
jgi:hypothetical protein